MGRCLVLDDFININDYEMEDPYTIELGRHVGYLRKNEDIEHVLIIGGGDCLIANHLLRRFPKIKKITMAEIDRRVVENIMEHFNRFDAWVIKENVDSGRMEIIYEDGASFVKK
mmetsp:Transcript_69484/g.96593  ORF Transcript_69484/g.96593 Transcript_69484/m.96593 type:complete len:114 (-) Transcript_69484:241-582(-)